MRASRQATLAWILGTIVLTASAARAQTYRGNLQCNSGFTGVTITAIDFWCSDGPCLNIKKCTNPPPPPPYLCPGLVSSFGTGNLSCAGVLDTDKIRDFVLAPCNPAVCGHGQQQVTANCRRWAEISYTCSINPAITRTVCMRVPGSVSLMCPNPTEVIHMEGDEPAAVFSLEEMLPAAYPSSDCLPPPRPYVGEFLATYTGSAVLAGTSLASFTTCSPPPSSTPGATSVLTFDAVFTGDLSIFGGAPVPVTAPATCSVLVSFARETGDTRFFDTEMLSLDISGGTLPPGTRIRESPTFQSAGATIIRSTSTGPFWIDSFFDIFTEIQLGVGAVWVASTDQLGIPYAGPMGLQSDSSTDTQESTPKVSALHPCVPNPFNPRTTILFDLARSGPVKLRILDVRGRHVRTLLDATRAAGRHAIIWNGLDGAGNPVPSGVYHSQLITGDITATRKMVVVK